MLTTKKSVFDFIENNDYTIFVYVSLLNVNSESELKAILMENESDIISGKIGKKRKIIHKSSCKIVFDDESNLYKTDKINNNYTFETEKLKYYVREIEIDLGDKITHKYMCYAIES